MVTPPFECTPMVLPKGVALLVLALAAVPHHRRGAQTATLKGKVVDSELGDPIPGAVVQVKPGGTPLPPTRWATSPFPDLKAGEVEVAVQAIGFESRSWKFNVQARPGHGPELFPRFHWRKAARGGGNGAGQLS